MKKIMSMIIAVSTASNGWYEIQLDEDIAGYVSNKVTKLIEK